MFQGHLCHKHASANTVFILPWGILLMKGKPCLQLLVGGGAPGWGSSITPGVTPKGEKTLIAVKLHNLENHLI